LQLTGSADGRFKIQRNKSRIIAVSLILIEPDPTDLPRQLQYVFVFKPHLSSRRIFGQSTGFGFPRPFTNREVLMFRDD